MKTLFMQAYDALSAHLPVYPSFDAVPLEKKPAALFAVLDQAETVLNTPAVTPEGRMHPVETMLTVTLLLPVYGDFRQAVDCFYETVVPVMLSLDGCVTHIRTDAVRVDHKLRRLVFSGRFTLKGLYLVRSEEALA